MYFESSLILSIRIYSAVTVIDSYCKTTCHIVSSIIQISWLLVFRIPLLKIFNFKPIWSPKTLRFQSSEHSPNISYPWNKNDKNIWTYEILTRIKVGLTKYPRENMLNQRDTQEKKFRTHEIPKRKNFGSTKGQCQDGRRPTMARNTGNLAHSSCSPKTLMKRWNKILVFITCSLVLYCLVCRNANLRQINALLFSNFNNCTLNFKHL